MSVYPVLLFIPHGGLDVPEELVDRTPLSERQILIDSDPYSREIYRLSGKVVDIVETSISRTYVDLNRTLEVQHSNRADKVVKDRTFFDEAIYVEGQEPDETLVQQLIERYYVPYHERLRDSSYKEGIELCLNCHCMSPHGPPLARDSGEKRPMICLGNGKGKTCPEPIMEKMAACFQQAFELAPDEVKINDPFWGKDITTSYGLKPIPWILVEMNEDLYFRAPWMDEETLRVDEARLAELNRRFEHALALYFG